MILLIADIINQNEPYLASSLPFWPANWYSSSALFPVFECRWA